MGRGKELAAVVSIAGAISPSLQKSIKSATSKLSGFNKKALAIGAGVTAAAAAGAAALAKLGTEAVKSAASFEKQMSNVATLLDGDVTKRIGELGDELLKVSNRIGIASEDLTDGLYQVISAFGDTAESSKTLEIAAKAAKAGNATTTESINLLSAVTKGFGDVSAEAQQKAADLAFQTVKLGQTSFPELAASMGKVIPLAQTMGVKQEELFGATATLTGVTGNTAEVMTQLRGTMQGFLQPSSNMAKALKQLGYADGKAMLEAEGLQGSLDLLKKSVGGNEIAFSNLFGSVEAKNAVLALAGAQAENMTEKTQAMFEASGAATKAFDAQTDNLEDTLAKLQNMGKNMLTKAGMSLLPIISDILEQAMPFIEEFLDGMGVALEGLAPLLSDLAATLFPAISKVLQTILPMAMKIVQAILPALVSLLNALMPIINLVLDLLTPILDLVSRLLMPILDLITTAISPLIEVIGNLISMALEPLQPLLNLLANLFSTGLGSAIEGIKPVIDSLIGVFSGVIDFISNIFAGNWQGAWDSIVGIFKNVWDGIDNFFKMPLNFIIDGINNFLSGLNQIQVPDWVPLVGGMGINIPLIPRLAKGGFTDGLSIAGEDPRYPTEAVISFNPLYRRENIEYWNRAGEMLGAQTGISLEAGNGGEEIAGYTATGRMLGAAPDNTEFLSESTSVSYDFGGFSFSPQIIVQGDADKQAILQALREMEPEFRDFMLDCWKKMMEGRYVSANQGIF